MMIYQSKQIKNQMIFLQEGSLFLIKNLKIVLIILIVLKIKFRKIKHLLKIIYMVCSVIKMKKN